jgi:ferritin-like metal-binding protein YciE
MKASIASYAFEAMEISSYRILIETADHVGDHETKRVCEQILREEEAMAEWLKQNIPMLTRRYLQLEGNPRRDRQALIIEARRRNSPRPYL